MATALVPDVAEIEVPVGGRVLVVSDLLLTPDATSASSSATADLAQAIRAWEGPGLVIVAGNLLDLLAHSADDPRGPDPGPAAALAAHPALVDALAAFAAAGPPQQPSPAGSGGQLRVLCLPGSRDGRLAWDGQLVGLLAERLGAEVALGAELHLATGGGTRRVRVEPGQRFDPRFATTDPRNPADTPLGHHLITELLPTLGPARGTWLAGADRLVDQTAFPRFLASRLAYRRLARHLWWLLVPLALALLAKLPVAYALPLLGTAHRHLSGDNAQVGLVVGVTTVVDLVLVLLAIAYLSRRTWAALRGVGRRDPGRAGNDGARDEARDLVTAGWTGLVTGHSLQPELTRLGHGFYANCGAGAEVVEERRARLGLPPVFLAHCQLSWVELEAGADLHARLVQGQRPLPGASLAERLAIRGGHAGLQSRPGSVAGLQSRPGSVAAAGHPVVVGSFPGGPSWPPAADTDRRLRRTRRRAAGLIGVAGLLDIASALTPPLRGRLHLLAGVIPLVASEAAAAVVALAGLALLALARGVRRGQRQAWAVSLALLAGTALLNLVKGADLEEAVVAVVVGVLLFANRSAFTTAVDRPSVRRGVLALLMGVVGITLLGTGAVEVSLRFDVDRPPLAFPRALEAVAQRLVGVRSVAIPHRVDEFLAPVLLGLGLGLACFALFLAFRPVVDRRRTGARTSRARARAIVHRHGQGTLDYFALRHDKSHFFTGDSVVAYAVYGGVCLVSPDPIGPVSERDKVWLEFRRFADTRGWTLAVLGASEEWLPAYRASGMHDLYVGDEAVVDVRRFDLRGGRNKGLRQAVNRIAKYGYTISFHDPAHLEPELSAALRQVMTKSRRGEMERGFSMTLGRVFDPEDTGLLLAVAHGPDGTPVAFCQYVPAPGIGGYSLDLMRRDEGEHPNGLIDFVVVRTIEHLAEQGHGGLGLNFATMRAVLAGEAGDTLPQRIERWMLRRMSGSMQIESLWRFNAKYDPSWQARFAVYDAPEHAVPVAMAIARAESFWELPVIGRFLMPSEAKGNGGGAGGGGGVEEAAAPSR